LISFFFFLFEFSVSAAFSRWRHDSRGYINQGAAFDGADFEAIGCLLALDNAYYWPNFYATATICKTNLPPNTSMRGPGWTQGTA
jgi:CO/xanthine dehydrogenase Mo-binding subunit